MRWLYLLTALLSRLTAVQCKAVFAHFMVASQVGNTPSYSTSDWSDDITQAQNAHIDAFALNIAYGDPTNNAQLPVAFSEAASKGFKLFFSFDYAGNGSWPQGDVSALINEYKTSSAYYLYNGQPFVSTFEGVNNTADWNTIIADTSCFFIPSWSSLGAKVAMETGIPNGLFSWGAWPEGPHDMFTTTDASYFDFLGGKPYMMPASPWFVTNLPGYHKNWLWRGDDTWYDRWTHIWYLAPAFVEIITWNDYGESHYIGPNRANAWNAFDTGKAPYNYASGMPHDGWRLFLPYVIDIYKNNGVATISQEGLVAWFRPQPASACATGGTTGNTASQLQITYSPAEIVQDKIFFTALLGSAADVTVTVGGVDQGATWTRVPDGNVGLWHGNVTYHGTGDVVVTVTRSGAQVAQVSGGTISTGCTDSIENWNAWVGSSTGPSVSVSAPSYLQDMNCTAGSGPGNYAELCAFACHYNYCPTVCTCTQVGITRTDYPTALGVNGCPAAGYDITFQGLCSFGCNYGVCPDVCTTVASPSDCQPPAASAAPIPSCTAGTGIDTEWNTICAFACGYGFCPNSRCICTAASYTANAAPAVQSTIDYPSDSDGSDAGLCYYACNRGFCPSPPCSGTNALTSVGDDVTVNPSWSSAKLVAITSQNYVDLLAYWTSCDEIPSCGAGFDAWAFGHGKVYDADMNTYTAGTCTGGPFGYNRAFCVETGVDLGSCHWRGTATSCSQTCLPGEFLVTQNTWIGYTKSGCKAGSFASLCCTQITIPNNELTTCAAANLDNILTGGFANVIRNVGVSRQYSDTYAISNAECGWNLGDGTAQRTYDKAVANGAVANYMAGVWEVSDNGRATFSLQSTLSPSATATAQLSCTSTSYVHETVTRVVSTRTTACPATAANACANYYSVARMQASSVITCPYSKQPGERRPVVSLYNKEHKTKWFSYVPDYKRSACQRDEFPPRAFMPTGRLSDWPQWVRLLPGKDNNRGGKLWTSLCNTKYENVATQGGLIQGSVCYSTVSTVRYVNALSLSFDTARLTSSDYLLSYNPCSITITNDVGFPLITEDPWYEIFHTTHTPGDYAYNLIPNSLLPRRGIGQDEVDALAMHGYHVSASLSAGSGGGPALDADFITVDDGNSTRRADAEDLPEILRILGWSPDEYDYYDLVFEGEWDSDGATIMPFEGSESETMSWESPITPVPAATPSPPGHAAGVLAARAIRTATAGVPTATAIAP
ncbi:glycosyl hydrolase family 71-domain-containing protein [Diplogelasinospora grovesii]|uniref:Glycosyl hydrolase family 71-domain-containing protein n=1 Tax=Diplogelasinospora grovesii TaxID=303347 RepID=A0AAN6MWG8_9PEZI|nr:glycosyl hydrolase family 71-domain-containing protein [Diplogelasinospora grovesii]